ncbi:MAG: CvpA family protein [Alphaproteobacteria bacterium]|nr:CvpA family protein [Alphaproteobacteria bacterium]
MPEFAGFSLADLIFLAFVIGSAIFAMIRGMLQEILRIHAWLLAFLVTNWLYPVLSPLFLGWVGEGIGADILTVIVPFVMLLVIFIAVAIWLSYRISDKVFIPYDHVFGFMWGFFRGCLILSVLYLGMLLALGANSEPSWLRSSMSHRYLQIGANWILDVSPVSFANRGRALMTPSNSSAPAP